MVIKSFLDGGNQADSTQYDVVSLASVSGTPAQWKAFERDWRDVVKKHNAPFLHTTDAVSLKNAPFTDTNGWDKGKRDAFLMDCVTAVEGHMIRPAEHYRNPQDGLIPYVITVVLDDFNRARAVNPEVPRSANVLCATQAVFRILQQSSVMGADFLHLKFDRNEPFMGPILDRMHNRKSRTHLKFLDRITDIGQSDMRDFPALQMADLLAWCISHKLQKPRHRWQSRLLRHSRWFDEWVEYDQMIRVIPGVSETVASWNLPPRRATR